MTMTPLDGGLRPVGARQPLRALGLTTAPATPPTSGHGATAPAAAKLARRQRAGMPEQLPPWLLLLRGSLLPDR